MTFRAGLLDGRRIAVAGGGGMAILGELQQVGACVDSLGDEVLLDEDAAMAWVRERLPLHALVFDASPSFGSGGQAGLRAAADLAWLAMRAVATGSLIPGEDGGKLVVLAPSPDAGAFAEAARAALENLARTLSVEWARFSVTAVVLCPGPETADAELAELVCFLLSPAGDYFSGCRFDLGVVPLIQAS